MRRSLSTRHSSLPAGRGAALPGPWIARVRRPAFEVPRTLVRAGLVAVFTLAMNTLPAAAQTTSADSTSVSRDSATTARSDAATVIARRSTSRAAEHPAPSPTNPANVFAPGSLRHVGEWVAYRQARHLASLPNEARLFYRRGLMARQAGQSEEAMSDVRGAADLDPSFVDPHLTLASWMLMREPSQALLQYATVVDLCRENFNLQLGFAANALILALQALFVGLLFAGLVIVISRQDDLTHAWREQISGFASPRGANVWGWAILVLPLVAGFGITLPTIAFLGYLWPALRARERALYVLLVLAAVSIPFGLRTIERLSLPMHTEAGPLFGVAMLENQPYTPETKTRLHGIADREPGNPLVQFGLGWVARRGADLPTSEQAYRRVLTLWPEDDRTLNNLGNVLAMEGHTEDALTLYGRAIAANPDNAAAYFNAAQMHTQRYEYQAATEALSKASALNFEMVKSYQQQSATDGLLPLADQWLTPAVFWKALISAPLPAELAGSIPTALRRHMEATGWRFSLAALVLAVAGLAAGITQHARLPLRNCSNCGRVVCRRCAQRRREHALCPACGLLESQAETPEFSRVLLFQQRKRTLNLQHLVRTALATLIPGYGLLAHRHVFTAVALASSCWLLTGAWLGWPAPFAVEPRLTLSGQELPLMMLFSAVGLVYAISLAGYAQLTAREREREAQLQSAQRGRITQPTRRAETMAA